MMITKTTPSEPTGPSLTEDEWDTVRKVLHDWGMIDSYFEADYSKVEELKKKLGVKD